MKKHTKFSPYCLCLAGALVPLSRRAAAAWGDLSKDSLKTRQEKSSCSAQRGSAPRAIPATCAGWTTAGTNGLFDIVDATGPAPAGYYRAARP